MVFTPLNPDFERRVRDSFARQGLMSFIGAELAEVKPGYCEIRVGYRKELTQQHGFFHAGIVGTLSDTCGGYAAFSLMPADSSILTVEYKLNLVSPGDGDQLIARGEVVKSGRTFTICTTDVIVVKNGVENLCATSLMTLIALAGKPDAPPEGPS
jgi:uncharacterized protein (TIGR00369 family)